MEKNTCLSLIRSKYRTLTKKERQVADYVQEHCEAVASMTTAELAQNAGVVKSVIVRFCQSLGYRGYTEFRLFLSREMARNEQFHFTPYIEKEDGCERIFDKIFASNIKTLHDTAAGLDRVMLQRAVDILDRAKNIYIYGIGTSAGMVCDFQYRLMQIGCTAFCFTDVANMRVSTLNIQKGDAVIGISNSGRTKATVDTLGLARESGAETIGLTSYPNSEIVKQCDCPLVIKTDEIRYPIEAISARIAHISVLDSLVIAISARRYDDATDRAAKTRDLIDAIRY